MKTTINYAIILAVLFLGAFSVNAQTDSQVEAAEQKVIKWANEAILDELTAVKGIGKATAALIMDARAQAPFTCYQDLDDVKRIGPVMLQRIKDHVLNPKPKGDDKKKDK